MTLSDVSIHRPVLTWMMTLALIVFGVLGYQRLGMDQFPDMDLPVLSVIATLEGADPEGMEEDVTDVLEEQLNTIAGVRSITSTTFSGTTQIRVEFELGTDLDIVAQKVRDKIDSVRRELPPEMDPPVVSDFDANDQPILWIPFHSTLPIDRRERVRRAARWRRSSRRSRAWPAWPCSAARTARSGSGCAATTCARAGSPRATCSRRCTASTSRRRPASSRAGRSTTA